ncbi:MAG: hypothetical protein V2A34_16460, partial [Lentisphaerota bacterium]
TVAVGAPEQGTLSVGTVHVYVRQGQTNWVRQQSLAGDSFFGGFGSDVDLLGDTLVIGEPLSDELGEAAGAASVYVREGSTWSRQALLLADDGAAGDQFGRKVTVGDGVAAVHATFAGTNNAGAVYLFAREGTNWIAQGKLTKDEVGANGSFGWDLDLRGNLLLVGAKMHDGLGLNSGAAWLYRQEGTNWIETASLWAGDGTAGDNYGCSIALGEQYAAIGAEERIYGSQGYILNSQSGYNPRPWAQAMLVDGNVIWITFNDLDRLKTNRVEVSDNLAGNTWTVRESFVPDDSSAQIIWPAVSNAAYLRISSP